MTGDVMDTHVTRRKRDKADRRHDLHDDIPRMSQADYEDLFKTIAKILGQS